MLIEKTSKSLLKNTRAKAKMIEYNVPEEEHIEVELEVDKLFLIAVAAIGDISVNILKNTEDSKILIDEAKASLEFASKYFDAYLNANLDEGNDDYYLLLGSVAYFLCDYVGSSKVLINKINAKTINLYSNGIEKALVSLLKDEFHNYEVASENVEYKYYLDFLQSDLKNYYTYGKYPNIKNIYSLRSRLYQYGSDLELLLGDIFGAIFLLKIQHSAIYLLPQYMHIDITMLQKLLFQSNAMKELWPAQRKIGEEGVFAGASAVIQMPTSAGKTKSISLIIGAAFLSQKTKLAVVVAPFRALCHEISNDFKKDFSFDDTIHIDELSDVLQQEELMFDHYDEQQKIVMIATPEKLIYLLRQRNDLIDKIGLIIFDEGHLFDEPKRGVVYELLISTIKNVLHNNIQKVLVSAIIPNAMELNNWMNDGMGIAISDNTIKATQKTVAINDWVKDCSKGESRGYGYLYFVNPDNLDEEEFFVPRLVPIIALNKKKTERTTRFFPDVNFETSKVMNNDLAIFYGLKLCHNGGVSIFCGKKDGVNSILKRILEIEARGYNIDSLLRASDGMEVLKICQLIADHYGKNSIYYLAGEKAAFAHHAGISNGVKISIEHAMRNGKINFIACTSTLAQGVNLPIRYLVVSSIYQGQNQIRVRDFHNLIGRVGRSGIFTEGSILLTESFVYLNSKNKQSRFNWKWEEYKKIIDNSNSEPCSSRILFLVRQCTMQLGGIVHMIPMKEIIINYYNNTEQFPTYLDKIKKNYPSISNEIEYTINEAIESLAFIESFLMSYLLDDNWEKCVENVQGIVKETLAYNLSTEQEKESLLELFHIIAKYCVENTPEIYQRYVCSRSLLGVKKIIYIQHWVSESINCILSCQNTEDLLQCLFDCLCKSSDNKIFHKTENPNMFLIVGLSWIKGYSYKNILDICVENKFRIIKRNNPKDIELDDVIKICDNLLSYDFTVILSSISEVVQATTENRQDIIDLFSKLSSELKYGLPYGLPIIIYEIGFSDRVVSQKISTYFDDNKIQIVSRYEGRKKLKKYYKDIEKILREYPSIYSDKLKEMVSIKNQR